MKAKRGIVISVIIALSICLSGCVDAMPDMTEEENDLVAEYAATILLKHSGSYNYRLVSENELERSIFEDNQAVQAAIEEAEKEKEIEEDKDETSTDDVNDSDENSSEDNSEDNDTSEENESSENNDTSEETITVETDTLLYLSEEDLAEYLGVGDLFSIRYFGKEVEDTYPKELSESGFQLNASKGNKLLVLNFSLENVTRDKVYCDMMEINPSIKLKLNKHGYANVENTLLINDFTTFMSDVKPGESVDLVTILEIPDEEIDELMLQIKKGKEKTELIVD